MARRAVIGVDLGTSSCKALALSQEGKVLSSSSRHYPTATPAPGLIEQDPEEWWRALCEAVESCVARTPEGTAFEGLGLSGHMSVLLPLDRENRPLRPAITIGDNRGARQAAQLNELHGRALQEATGNVALTAFTLPKLLWYRENERESFRRTETVLGAKDYLRWRLTGLLGSEPTEAGNTMLLDYRSRDWNRRLMADLDLPERLFPRLAESLELVGELTSDAARATGLPAGLPVIAGLADMAASTLGSGLTRRGRTALTLGTSGQITLVVGAPAPELVGSFTYHPHALPGRLYTMASLFTGGLGLDWLGGLLASAFEQDHEAGVVRALEMAALSAPGARGVTFHPFLSGSGSPEFDSERRGAFLNIALAHGGNDIARAVLEGVGYSARRCLELLEARHGAADEIRIGGGGFRSELWRQMFADILARPLQPLAHPEAGPLGTALAAGFGVSLLPELEQWTERIVETAETVDPNPESLEAYSQGYAAYLRGAESTRL
jgi:xylulokinase